MRYPWIWGLAVVMAMVLTIGQESYVSDALAADPEKQEEFFDAELWERQGKTLKFRLLKGEEVWEIWGDLTDGTLILDEKGGLFSVEGLLIGSKWRVVLQHRMKEGKIPIILEMQQKFEEEIR